MIAVPIQPEPDALETAGDKALLFAINHRFDEHCQCITCGSSAMKMLGSVAIGDDCLSLLSPLGAHCRLIEIDDQPMTLATIFQCGLGHKTALILRQHGDQIGSHAIAVD